MVCPSVRVCYTAQQTNPFFLSVFLFLSVNLSSLNQPTFSSIQISLMSTTTSSQGSGSVHDDFDDDSDSASTNSASNSNSSQTYLWSNYSVPQLRELLRQRGHLTTGSKSALKKRLKNLDRATAAATAAPSTKAVTKDLTEATAVYVSTQESMLTSAPLDFSQATPKDMSNGSKAVHPARARAPRRTNSFSAHFAGRDQFGALYLAHSLQWRQIWLTTGIST